LDWWSRRDGLPSERLITDRVGESTISAMRRAVVLVLLVAGLFAVASVHLSNGDPLPIPDGTVVVYDNVK